MKFGKRTRESSGEAMTPAKALAMVKMWGRMAQTAGDYKRAVETSTVALMPAFRALDIEPPYFTNLFAKLDELAAKDGPIGEAAREARTEAHQAREHLEKLRTKPARKRKAKSADKPRAKRKAPAKKRKATEGADKPRAKRKAPAKKKDSKAPAKPRKGKKAEL
jgi:hypothetical protein